MLKELWISGLRWVRSSRRRINTLGIKYLELGVNVLEDEKAEEFDNGGRGHATQGQESLCGELFCLSIKVHEVLYLSNLRLGLANFSCPHDISSVR